jgi:hypothetical protein
MTRRNTDYDAWVLAKRRMKKGVWKTRVSMWIRKT